MFKDRLNEALDAREMKAIDLAKLTGIPKSTISNYLSGRMVPKRDRVQQIAKVLNVQEAWLMDYDVAMDRPTTGDEFVTETIKMLRLLTPEQQNIVIRLIGQIIDRRSDS